MACCGSGHASAAAAMKAPRERLLYTIAIYTGTGIQKPDHLCTIDADPDSPTYSKVIHRLGMPGIGDELHHMGRNACSCCFGDSSMTRSHLLVPGVRSSNIHVVDTATDPRTSPAQGDRRCRDQGQGGPQRAPHGALHGFRHHHFDARQCRGQGTGVTFTPTGISASWADVGIPWGTSRSDTISGTSRATM